MEIPLLSVTHVQCDARPLVAFPACVATNKYCLVTVAPCVNKLPRVALDSMTAGIWTRDLLIATAWTWLFIAGRNKHIKMHVAGSDRFHLSLSTVCSTFLLFSVFYSAYLAR